MAKLIRCRQGHVFDAEKHAACPVCGEEVIFKASDDGETDGEKASPPPALKRTIPLIIVGAVAVLAAAAVAGGYFVFRPSADIRAPEKPIASPSPVEKKDEFSPATTPSPTADPPSPTFGGETNRTSTEPPVVKQAFVPRPSSTGTGDSEAARQAEDKAGLTPNAPAPTPAPLANVDPAIVGEWELPVNSGRWILRIEPNGAFAFHTEPASIAKPDSGVFSAEAGHWATLANNGFNDGGSYSVVSPDTFIAKGRLGTATWRRVVGAPASILEHIDPRTVGDWALSMASGRWVWRIKADGTFEFHSEANDGAKASVGTVSSMGGRWSLRAPDGYTDGGIYSFPTADTFLATGHLGAGAWRRIP